MPWRWLMLSADLWLTLLGMLLGAGVPVVYVVCGCLAGRDLTSPAFALAALVGMGLQPLLVASYLHRPKFILPPAQDEPVAEDQCDGGCCGPQEEP